MAAESTPVDSEHAPAIRRELEVAADRLSRHVCTGLDLAAHSVSLFEKEAACYMRQRPARAILLAFGLGLLTGLILRRGR